VSLFENADLIIVGAGFFGLTIADKAASAGFNVTIIDKRSHSGGSANAYFDKSTGIEVHRYGPHVFHTNSDDVWNYLSRFTGWYPYTQRTWTVARGGVWPLPVNLATISLYTGAAMSPGLARNWVEQHAAEIRGRPGNLEEKAIASIGRPLYELLIRGYTAKQWDTDPKLLPPETVARMPVRYTYDNRYFTSKYEGLPIDGYDTMFSRMVNQDHISLYVNTEWDEVKSLRSDIPVVYTGPVDAYFGYRLGRLNWRVVDLEMERLAGDFQGIPVMYYADEHIPFTRISEFKHFRPDRDYGEETIIAREYSRAAVPGDVPHYPVNTPGDRMLYDAYATMARSEPNTFFGGRLATYRYLDMHQAVGSALKMWSNQIEPQLSNRHNRTIRA